MQTLDPTYQVETNIDDQSPESWPYLIDKLLESGAYDAWLTPIIMKKGRPAITLTFLAPHQTLDTLIDLVALETTTIGLRYFPVERKIYPREIKTVETPWGEVRVKVTSVGEHKKYKPEYEDCRKLAKAANLPLRQVTSWLECFHKR
ncbi:MAG: nickel insertion protein [Candidatus Adiutrix sp.]